MLRGLEGLKFIERNAGGFKIQICAQDKMVEKAFHFQALQFEKRRAAIFWRSYQLFLQEETARQRSVMGELYCRHGRSGGRTTYWRRPSGQSRGALW